MKFSKLFLTLCFLFTLMTVSHAATPDEAASVPHNEVELVLPTTNQAVIVETALPGKPCTVNFEIEKPDGTVVSGTVTFDDVNWFRCATIKVYGFFSRLF